MRAVKSKITSEPASFPIMLIKLKNAFEELKKTNQLESDIDLQLLALAVAFDVSWGKIPGQTIDLTEPEQAMLVFDLQNGLTYAPPEALKERPHLTWVQKGDPSPADGNFIWHYWGLFRDIVSKKLTFT